MNEDVIRLVKIIKSAPSPFGKTDSELAQEYRNWYLGSRLNMKTAEQRLHSDAGESADLQAVSNADNESASQAVD